MAETNNALLITIPRDKAVKLEQFLNILITSWSVSINMDLLMDIFKSNGLDDDQVHTAIQGCTEAFDVGKEFHNALKNQLNDFDGEELNTMDI